MKITLALAALTAGLLVAGPAAAQHSRTVEYEGQRYDASRTVTHDPATRTTTRDTNVTRLSDGATAESSVVRQRVPGGVSRDRYSRDFAGRTSDSHYDRQRTPHGWVASGEHDGRFGQSASYRARGVVTPQGTFVRRGAWRH